MEPRPQGNARGSADDARRAPAEDAPSGSPSGAPGGGARRELPAAADPRPPSEATPVLEWRGLRLSDFQVRAVAAVRAGRNVLVGAPTGAGKTLVAEYAIHDAVARGRRCIYTAPIKALSNQKYRDFRAEAGFDVGLLTGDVTISPRAQVLVMTTEILRNEILEDPGQLADVEYAIFDEVHFLDDVERGSVWEEALIFAPAGMRFICLSATVANIRELGEWIGSIRPHELEVIRSDLRPVPLHHLVYSPRDGLLEPAELGAVRRKVRARAHADGGREAQGGRRGGRHGDHKGRGNRGRRQEGRDERGPQRGRFEVPDLVRLLDELQGRGLLPTLVFSFSRKDCARLARRNEGRDLLDASERRRMIELQRELIEIFRLPESALSSEVFTMARNGLGYHHAGLLPIDKELVERMFTSGLLKMLFTTETFALGINMPARTVVFHALKKFDGVSVDWLRTRDFLQMAGRAGRQGLDREGLVVSVVGERELLEAPFERLLSGAPEPVRSRFGLSYSSLLHLIERLGRERLGEAWSKSLRMFQLRSATPKVLQKNQRRQAREVDTRLGFLAEIGYVDAQDQLSARGRIARLINGFEVQVTELLFSGLLENLPPEALATVFVALVYEERRRAGNWLGTRSWSNLRKSVDRFLGDLASREAAAGVEPGLKLPDWGLTAAVSAWCRGATFEELEELTDVGPGDLCRSFRMAVQLMRQVRRAIDPAWDLHELLGLATQALDRDEVDARRQLELG